ncbi:ABC transporter permease [Hydrogenophaga palleronii]|uniref:ABC transporter permease n=1 Tax=Hydrogenophaga palleronii TaxID=65655 RepID=UPI0008243DCB|nr:ABC-2 family transporter protein [Hydrogenophaga palleronii]
MSPRALVRPYAAAFASRFLQMLQYRTAAYAGFVTQCWWGGIKVMVLAAFYGSAAGAAGAPLSLAQVITYTWLAQGLLALLPWMGDPEVAQAVRSGSVAYDRLRPVDAYTLWFVRSAGWIAARVLPRVLLMLAFAGIALPLAGLGDWAWQAPASLAAGLAFAVSLLLALLLSTAFVMLLNIATTAALNERGINTLAGPAVVVLSGNLLPLPLLPDAWQTLLLLQPLAGVMDIPARIYFGQLAGTQALVGLALQCLWTVLLVLLGRVAMGRTMRRLEVQGG